MSLLNMTANSLIGFSKVIGPSGLKLLRKLMPVSIKRRLSRFIVRASSTNGEVIVAKTGQKFVSIKEPVFLHLLMEGEYESGLSSIARRLIRSGDICVDVGANFGWYSILMADVVGEKGNVISIEPNPDIFEILRRNVELNSFDNIVKLENSGVGSERSKAKMVAGESNSGVGYLASTATTSGDCWKTVDVYPLFDVVGDAVGKIAYIKIDVEGFEPFVFKGGQEVFESENLPIIQLELNVGALKRQHGDISEFINMLNALDATIYAGETGALKKIDVLDESENHDLFFIPKSGLFSDRLI